MVDITRVEDMGGDRQPDNLLKTTIYSKNKVSRFTMFTKAWEERWDGRRFGSNEDDSPFAQFSSRGWKIHLAFPKGNEYERHVALKLFLNSLYFKVEAFMGTYFLGATESGATIYIGSYDDMQAIARTIQEELGSILSDGQVAVYPDGKKISIGSGADIEVLPKITARFDVAKTKYGWEEGNRKYVEHGIATWTALGGIPILKTFEKEVSEIENNWNSYTEYQRKIKLQRLQEIYDLSKNELIKDFGEEFVFGSSK